MRAVLRQVEQQWIVLRDGHRVSVTVTGEGSPLVLLHGFSGSAQGWGRVVEGLEGSHRLVLVDLLGHGRSDKPRDVARYRMEELLEDVEEVVDRYSPPVDLLGYSMGARLALAFAARRGERVHRLILESGSPGLLSREERDRRVERDEQLAAAMTRDGIQAFLEAWRTLPVLSSLQAALPPEEFAAVEAQRAANDPQVLAAVLRGSGTGMQPSFWENLRDLPHPTLLITGQGDTKFTRTAASMVERLPQGRHVAIPGAGHRVHRERPRRWLRAVRAFMAVSGGARHRPDAP